MKQQVKVNDKLKNLMKQGERVAVKGKLLDNMLGPEMTAADIEATLLGSRF